LDGDTSTFLGIVSEILF